jgi:hypothetical protein
MEEWKRSADGEPENRSGVFGGWCTDGQAADVIDADASWAPNLVWVHERNASRLCNAYTVGPHLEAQKKSL